MKIKRLSCVNIGLDSMEEGVAFFRDIMGAEIGPEMTGIAQAAIKHS